MMVTLKDNLIKNIYIYTRGREDNFHLYWLVVVMIEVAS